MPDMNDKFHADLYKHFEGRTDITPEDIRAFEDKWRSEARLRIERSACLDWAKIRGVRTDFTDKGHIVLNGMPRCRVCDCHEYLYPQFRTCDAYFKRDEPPAECESRVK